MIIQKSRMHWEKSPPSALARSRPYQGVRVRDPVKELLRKKRSLDPHSTKTAPPTADVVTHNIQSCYTQGLFGLDVAGSSPSETAPAVGDLQQFAGWRAAPPAHSAGLHPAVAPWASSDFNQQDPSAQTLAYAPTPTRTADVYMQTLCPSYTMLTYTHTPLLTNFGPIPLAPAQGSLPQMELPDSALTYLPWPQPITTISAMPSSGVQFASSSSALPGSPLVHMPLSMSLTTMFPQLEAQSLHPPQPQILEMPQRSEHQLDTEPQDDEGSGAESESPSLLDKLLEEQKGEGEEEDKDSYSSSIFIPNV
ncbi:POU domain class 2-associating factor 1 [Pseudochaenichthys georgianus]|uniref:POU domain class 2-associating factor 1 n=1 Tax=Pseudochaenichthys georgianus TaxID=52239 RepID=UPI00146B0FF2|nr:POU domain class 2-associating factor 1 [Pseudochaenichthys georgianus]